MRLARNNDLLANVPLFSALTARQRRTIDQAITGTTVAAGSVVARQGRAGHELGIITAGTATVTIDGRVVATLRAGDFFGEVSLLDGGAQTATITADTDLELAIISHQDFVTVLGDNPSFAVNLLKGVAARLRSADDALRAVPIG